MCSSQLAAVRQTAARVNAEAPAALRARLAPLDGQLVSLGAELLRLYVQPDEGVRNTVEASTAALVQQAEGLPEALRTPLVGLAEPVALILREEPALTQTAQQIELLPTGPRVNSMSDAFDRAFQAMSDEKEQYRVYLAFYSLALLVFLAYVLWQLGRSYVKINHANEALKAANENLEQRVDERTKELSRGPQAPEGVGAAAGADREDVLAGADGGGHRPRDQHPARLREEQPRHPQGKAARRSKVW